MRLEDKMFNRSARDSGLRSSRREESDKRFFDRLFADTWEVLVIKRDEQTGKLGWFTVGQDSVAVAS